MSKIKWDGAIGSTDDGYYAQPDMQYGWRAGVGVRVVGFTRHREDLDGVIERDRALTRMIEKRERESEPPLSLSPAGESAPPPTDSEAAQPVVRLRTVGRAGGWRDGDEVYVRAKINHIDGDGDIALKYNRKNGSSARAWASPSEVFLAIPVVDDTGLLSDLDDDAKARVRAETAEPVRVSVCDSLTLNAYQRGTRRTIDATAPSGALTTLALGLAGEAGEVCDLIKKIEHGHPVDGKKICEELGDTLFYVAAIADRFGLSLAEVAAHNERKLRKRYPDGFSVEASIARADVEKGCE